MVQAAGDLEENWAELPVAGEENTATMLTGAGTMPCLPRSKLNDYEQLEKNE